MVSTIKYGAFTFTAGGRTSNKAVQHIESSQLKG